MQGSYVGGKFCVESANQLINFIQTHDIPNGVEFDDIHSTILYSTVTLPADFQPLHVIDPPWNVIPIALEVWDRCGHPSCKALVLKYECLPLVARHHYLLNTYDVNHGFDLYIPHVTLSYDIGDIDYTYLHINEFKLQLCGEYLDN